MGLGKLQAFLMGVFGGAVSGQGATTGQALVKQANGSWAPGTVSAGSAAQFVATSNGTDSAPALRGTDADTGIHFDSGTQIHNVVNGVLVGRFTSTGLSLVGDLAMGGSANIQVVSSSGMQIATSTGEKIGFYGTTPVTQRTGIADPSGGATVDTQARAAITSVITALEQLGLLATV